MNASVANGTKSTSIAELKPAPEKDVQNLPAVTVGFTSLQGFELVQRAAKMLCASTLVPKEYQNNIPNCAIALNMAMRVGADPLMVMQNLVIVHNRPTWSSQFLIATVNTCGRFSALRYEFFGARGTDEWGCRAWAIEKATGEKLVGTDVTIAIAKKEGWYGRNGSKWQSIPQQMLMYRAGSWWTRAYAPELSMGLHTADEFRDVYDAEKQDDGSFAINLGDMKDVSAAKAEAAPPTTTIDPATGEVIDGKTAPSNEAAKINTPEFSPKLIPMKGQPGNAVEPDFEGWSAAWKAMVKAAPDVASLDTLMANNAKLITQMQGRDADAHILCVEAFENRKESLSVRAAA